jgi:hypothetical protein
MAMACRVAAAAAVAALLCLCRAAGAAASSGATTATAAAPAPPAADGHGVAAIADFNATVVAPAGTDLNVDVVQLVSSGLFPPRYEAGVVWHDDALFVMGGMDVGGPGPNGSAAETAFFNDVYQSLDGGSSWTALPNASWPQRAAFGLASFDDLLVVYGGRGYFSLCFSDVWMRCVPHCTCRCHAA